MIEATTLSFLSELKENNHKDWFDENRSRYQVARTNILSFVDRLIEEMVGFDPTLGGLEAKGTLFRINRDVRFSKDKSPYKTNFAASIARGGRRSPSAGYFVSIDATGGMVGGGSYMPEGARVKQVRAHMDMHGEEWENYLEKEEVKSFFGEMGTESMLKTAPKGYEKDHPYIHLLRRKSFTLIRQFDAEAILREDFFDTCIEGFEILHPFIKMLNEAYEADQ